MDQEASFGQIVKEYRRLHDLTQAELARRVACATITIRRIEAETLRPSQQIADRLAMALNVPLDDCAAFVHLARSVLRETPEPSPLPTPPPDRDEIGQEDLSGRAIRGYELGERVGTGGFGIVYRAVQPLIEREVAIKIILPKYADHSDFIRRFEAEAQLVARLEHPYIVPLYDYWREPGGAYLVMRLMRGGSLRGKLKEGALGLETVAVLLEQIGAALHAAHRFGVIHRDLKPSNVLLDEEGNGYLADFGIAKNLSSPNLEKVTKTALIGSPAYISPEQIRSEPVRPHADIYCLGVLLYEMLTGRQPFRGPTPFDYIVQHLHEPLPLLDTHPFLDPVIRRAMAKAPLERYADIPSLLADFRQATTAESAAAIIVDRIPHRIDVSDEELENSYKGLRPFAEADAGDFFGRAMLIQELLGRLSEADDAAAGAHQDMGRFLAVVGPSGSGKSSVVKAGLLPALRQGGLPGSENWFVVDLVPGPHPLEELERALLSVAVNSPESLLAQLREDERGLLRAVRRVLPQDPEIELVLVIDQFEEIFTLVEDEAVRAHLLDNLITAVLDSRSRVRVIVTMRADFTGRALEYVDFGELLRQRTVFVLPLTTEELEQAVVSPAARVGVAVEPGLVATIVRDVGDQPGMLPLLQYALTELFEQREGRVMTLHSYRESGGVSGALARRAEDLYAGLDETGQGTARQILLRLVTLGEGVEDTRRRVLRSELVALTDDAAQMNDIIDIYGRYRLFTFDHDPLTRGPTVEVAHEALLREWGRLRGWLDESRSDVRLQRLLGRAATEWLAAERDDSYLLRGARLDQFETWSTTTNLALTPNEREYLAECLAERESRRAAEAVRQEREAALERRSRRFLRALVGVLGVATVVALILSMVAFDQRGEALGNAATATVAQGQTLWEAATAVAAQAYALEQQRVAEQQARQALESYSLAMAANARAALANKDTATALVLALEASRIDQPPEQAQETLLQTAYAPGPRLRFTMADIAPNLDGRIPGAVAISPDGRTALAGLDDGTIVLWELESRAEIRRFAGHTDWVNDVIFSPDGQMALSGSNDTTLILWDVTSGQIRHRLSGHRAAVLAVDISPDGHTAVSGGEYYGGEIILWDLEMGVEIRRFERYLEGERDVTDVAFSSDGRTVLACTGGGCSDEGCVLVLWDAETGEEIQYFGESGIPYMAVDISSDGERALVGGSNYLVELWDLQAVERLETFTGHNRIVVDVAFLPDGRTALSGAQGGRLGLWDIGSGELVMFSNIQTGTIHSLALSPDGGTALSSATDGVLALWDLYAASEVRRFEGHTSTVTDLVFTPDGKYLLSSGGLSIRPFAEEEYTLRLWDVETGEQVRVFEGHTDSILGIAIDSGGRRALSASADQSVRLWDLETGEEIRRFLGHRGWAMGVGFSPDGQTIVSTGAWGDGRLILWDVESGELLRAINEHSAYGQGRAICAAFSPDGQTILSSGDGGIFLWDAETGELIRQMENSYSDNICVRFSPDGSMALSSSWSAGVALWDVATGQEIRRYEAEATIMRAAFGPDGRTALFGDDDGTVVLWDLETGEVLNRFSGHTSVSQWGIAINPDGRTGVSGGEDFRIIQWDLTTPTFEELLAWIATNRYVRELTCEERELYGIEPFCEAQ